MSENKTPYIPSIEWEGLQHPYEMTTVDPNPYIPQGTETVVLWRDEAYNLKGQVRGQIVNPDRPSEDRTPGTTIPATTITGTDKREGVNFIDDEAMSASKFFHNYELPDCYIHGYSQNWSTGGLPTFERGVRAWLVRKTPAQSKEAVRLTEWYLNGPKHSFIFGRSMVRALNENYKKSSLMDSAEVVYPELQLRQETHNGYALIHYNDKRFIIYQIPKDCGPSWSENLAIEYRLEWGGIPDEDEREAISEIVSFVIGRRLLRIGYTTFDMAGWAVEEVSLNPWGDNVVAICGKSGITPIRLDPKHPRKIEEVLHQLVPEYLKVRKKLNVCDALWRYWLSQEAAIGVDLPLVSAAVDGIVNAWLESNQSKSQGVYMPGKKFKNLLHDELASINRKLDGIEHKERILNVIRTSYEIKSVRSKWDTFFEEIRLPVGPIERNAIYSRHGMAHGASSGNNDDYRDMRQARHAYHTLFERIVLKILGYQGEYVDHATIGFPERPIDQAIGGAVSTPSIPSIREVKPIEIIQSVNADGVFRNVTRNRTS